MWARLLFSRGDEEALWFQPQGFNKGGISMWVRPYFRAEIGVAVVSAAPVSTLGFQPRGFPYVFDRISCGGAGRCGFSRGGVSRGDFHVGSTAFSRGGGRRCVFFFAVSAATFSAEGVSMWARPYFCAGMGDAVVAVPVKEAKVTTW